MYVVVCLKWSKGERLITGVTASSRSPHVDHYIVRLVCCPVFVCCRSFSLTCGVSYRQTAMTGPHFVLILESMLCLPLCSTLMSVTMMMMMMMIMTKMMISMTQSYDDCDLINDDIVNSLLRCIAVGMVSVTVCLWLLCRRLRRLRSSATVRVSSRIRATSTLGEFSLGNSRHGSHKTVTQL